MFVPFLSQKTKTTLQRKAKRRAKQRHLAGVEALENRRLMAILYDGATSTLHLVGTNANDRFDVATSSNQLIRVQEGPGVLFFNPTVQPISRINADLGAGNDTLSVDPDLNISIVADGGAGNDNIEGAASDDTLLGGDGRDWMFGNAGKDIINGQDGMDWIEGGKGDDLVFGELGNDIIFGQEGDDVVHGGDDSDDYIEGGPGNDVLYGDQGNDWVLGQEGEDIVYGNDGNDVLIGGADIDVLDGGNHDDELYGNEGDDTLKGGSGDDHLAGDAGNDWLEGGPQADTLLGGDGNDSLYGQGDADGLEGGRGDDLMSGAEGDDILNGGSGDDVMTGGDDDDVLDGEGGDDELDGDAGDDLLLGGDGDDVLRGGGGDDELRGERGNDSLHGHAGSDLLFGNAGMDGLYGGGETDELSGGPDSDRFIDRIRFVFIAPVWFDNATDIDNDDVRIAIKDGDRLESKAFAGQADTFTIEAGAWTDQEVEQIDQGLAILHEATGNKQLLETAGAIPGRIDLIRYGSVTNDNGNSGSISGWNSGGGEIGLAESTFSRDSTRVIDVLIHEIGHNWDQEYDEAGWHGLSGWTESSVDLVAPMVQGADAGGEWWFDSSLDDAQFVTNYGQTNPNEDFAESFAAFFLDQAGLRLRGEVTPLREITGKFEFMEDLVADLS